MPNHRNGFYSAIAIALVFLFLGVFMVLVLKYADQIDGTRLKKTDSEISIDGFFSPSLFREIEMDPDEWKRWPQKNGIIQADNSCMTDRCLEARQRILDYKLQEAREIEAFERERDLEEGRQR